MPALHAKDFAGVMGRRQAILAFLLHLFDKVPHMKRSQAIALTALTTTLAAGITIFFVLRRNHRRRKDFVANAGYEMAYDIRYPPRYRRHKRQNGHRNAS